jgi:hypothetical protein
MVEQMVKVTSGYEERLRRCEYVPRLPFGRRMLRDDGALNPFILVYLFCEESIAIQFLRTILIILRLGLLVLFFF